MFRRRLFGRDILHRWEGNPLIGIDDLDFKCADIHSAGAVVTAGGETILLVTIEHLAGYQAVHLARSDDRGSFAVEPEPFIGPCRGADVCGPHESDGVMDARVTFFDGTYYIMYLASGRHGFRVGLVSTEDFIEIKRYGLVNEPDTKAGCLFPEKFGGRFARLDRPREGNSIWISYSNDLVYWGGHDVVLSPRDGFWDTSRVGAGAPPMRIDQGWLLIYYGVKETSAGPLFRLGAAILDADDPTRLVGRTNIPILAPRKDYERTGDLRNIVFCTGAFIEEDHTVNLVYGAADSCICIATTTVEEIVDNCSLSRREF